MNKKGAEKIISVYWFAILFIVTAAIVYMTAIFYGSPYDVRELEAQILTDKIAECLSPEGDINANLKNFNQDNFPEECNLNFNVEDACGWDDDQYYAEVKIYNFNSQDILVNTVSSGNTNLKQFCSLQGKNLPFCLERSLYVNDENDQYKINILSVIGKAEKNAESGIC